MEKINPSAAINTCSEQKQQQGLGSEEGDGDGNLEDKLGVASTSCNSSQTPLAGLRSPTTPPDQASIQSSMDKNKETLKRKLMLRRTVNELVDRGIYPPLNTPHAFAEQTKQLERAKTGDLLRHKIQHRPDRQSLVQQHILEDTTIDPSLHERQRLLKRSRLLDGLNDKLAHRPGPLELVQGNILQPVDELADAIKDGTLHFIPTHESDLDQHGSVFAFDEESAGSDGVPSPSLDESSGISDISSPTSATPAPATEAIPFSLTFTKSISLPHTFSRPPSTITGISTTAYSATSPKSVSSSGKSRSKKAKPKAASKARIIKFHEYKGPPSVVKSQSSSSSSTSPSSSSNINIINNNSINNNNNNNNSSSNDGNSDETPYHIMLQQQQLFLQWQLEFQQKQQQPHQVTQFSGNTALNTSSNSNGDTINSTSPMNLVNSVIMTNPVVTTSSPFSSSHTILQPGNVVQAMALQKPQLITNVTNNASAIFSGLGTPTQNATSVSQPTIPAPSPPHPAQQHRPIQSVTPRPTSKPSNAASGPALSFPKLVGNLEEMKVADLKAELKKRSLPVSGPKPHLIERLKPYTENSSFSTNTSQSGIKPSSQPPSRVPTPLQFSQTTFHVKKEPNGEVVASPITRPIPSSTASLFPSSSPSSSSSFTPSASFSMPITLPFNAQGLKTVVSVKPMVKDEPMALGDSSPPCSPPTLQARTPGPQTPMSPDLDHSYPPSLTPKPCQTTLPHNLLKQNNNSVAVVTVNTDQSQPASVVPAEMTPMEVDSVSVDLNQGVDQNAFKAASLGQNLDSNTLKAFVQPLPSTINLSPNFMDSSTFKNAALDNSANRTLKALNVNSSTVENIGDIKTINLSPNLDGSATLKSINLTPNLDTSAFKTLNHGSLGDTTQIKDFGSNISSDGQALRTISVGPSNNQAAIKTVKLSQLSPNPVTPVQVSTPLAQSLTTPASLVQLQQLQQIQTLQQLQQQLLHQTQVQQHQLQQQTQQQLQQNSQVPISHSDQVVLAQAKQIEELQRQLQESNLKLKLQQLQQQQMQLQQQQETQKQLLQVTKLDKTKKIVSNVIPDQMKTTSQASQLLPASLQLHQQSPSLVGQQTSMPIVQQKQAGSIFLNNQAIQQTPVLISGQGLQQLDGQAPQSMPSTALRLSNQNIMTNSITGGNGETAKAGQLPPMPYTIHINLTSSGQVKLPPQLQPITTSTAAAGTATKSCVVPPLQPPKQFMLNALSQNGPQTSESAAGTGLSSPKVSGNGVQTSGDCNEDNTATIQLSQSSASHMFGFPQVVMTKPSVSKTQSVSLTSPPSSSNGLISAQANGLISRTNSLPNASQLSADKLGLNSTSNSYFQSPLKEPPRYDEAIKTKKQLTVPAGQKNSQMDRKTPERNSNSLINNLNIQNLNNLENALGLTHHSSDMKSQVMDDVLEILIRHGDLPPNAANEAVLIPKSSQSLSNTSAISESAPKCASESSNEKFLPTKFISPNQSNMLPPSVQIDRDVNMMSSSGLSPRDQTLTSVHMQVFNESLFNNPPTAEVISSPSSLNLNDAHSTSDPGELLDWEEMLPSPDLSNMDWTADPGFGNLDLGDSGLQLDAKNSPHFQSSQLSGADIRQHEMSVSRGISNLSNSNPGLRTPSVHGSESDLSALGLAGDSSEAVDPATQMDMSDWLDVIMPSSSSSININSIVPSTNSSDPILTPQTQQEVFELFSMDDPDFGSSAQSTMSWDKLAEQSTSS